MEGNEHGQHVQTTIDPVLLGRSEWCASALLLPRVALGWMSLQVGWSAMHPTSLPQVEAGKLLALSLTLSGIALVLGLFTGPAALVSGTLGVAAWEQGGTVTASTTIALAMLLMLVWRSAGQIGLDRWLLPSMGLAGYRGALVVRQRTRT